VAQYTNTKTNSGGYTVSTTLNTDTNTTTYSVTTPDGQTATTVQSPSGVV